MKTIQKYLIRCASWLFAPIRRLPFKWQERFVDTLMASLTRSGNYFNTFHQRPKKAADITIDYPVKSAAHDCAVVMQGPLVLEDDFTLETVRLYRRTFAGCTIIVSTWDGEDADTISALRATGATVITSPRPQTPGAANINYQMTSTLAGLRVAQQQAKRYAIKTRCDQRFYAAGLAEFLIALLAKFPPCEAAEFRMKQRIVGLNINTARHRPYAFSDMFQFGLLTDLLALWDLPFDERNLSAAQVWGNSPCTQDVSRQKIGEAYVYVSYMEKIGRPHNFEYDDHFRILRDQFVIIDKEMLDLLWFKYGHSEYRVCADPKYSALRVHAKFNFRDWLTLQFDEGNTILPSKDMLNTREVFE